MHSPQFGSLSVSRSVPPCHLLMSSGMYGLRFYSKCTSRPKHLSVGDHIPHQRHKPQDGKTEKWRKVNFLDRNLTTRATALATPRIIGSNRRFFLFLVSFGWSDLIANVIVPIGQRPFFSSAWPPQLTLWLSFLAVANRFGLQLLWGGFIFVNDRLALTLGGLSCNRWRLLASQFYYMRESDVTEWPHVFSILTWLPLKERIGDNGKIVLWVCEL